MENEINKGISVDEINGIKAEINVQAPLHADISESANKALSNALDKPTKSLGNAGGIVLDFFNKTILYPMHKYNIKATHKLKEYAKSLEEKLAEIPTEKLVEPKINVIGPAFEALKYNIDEEILKNMFTNLIVNSKNIDCRGKVLPSYVEIIKQLDSKDAAFLTNFKETDIYSFRCITLKVATEGGNGYRKLDDNFILICKNNSEKPTVINTLKLDNITIDNLERLKLVELNFNEWYTENQQLYDTLFSCVSSNIKLPEGQTLSFDKGILYLTDFGKNFIDICLS
ncbi:MAG: DUF4393 domain-containing protein [Clostridia bacterium]